MEFKKNTLQVIFNFQFLISVCLFLNSCTPLNTFEKNTTIPNYQWKSNYDVKGSFTITDTASAYSIYLILRHTDSYTYNNIWVNIQMQSANDSIPSQKINIPLATDATGWMGVGMNDIWEVRQLLVTKKFKKGIYNYTIDQIMREDPLPWIMSVGINLQKQ